jgi:AcrR family transcriptional regulator
MMAAAIREKRSGELTRQRILQAALARFAAASYEEVGLRDIARDVGVDVALVHRSFGSKEQLFSEVFKTAIQSERLLAFEKAELGAVFAKTIFETESELASGHAEALQIFIHSLSSPRAREVLRGFALRDLIEPLATKLDDRAQQRAALLIACLIGISILRDVLEVEPLLDASRAQTEPLVEKLLGVCLDDDRQSEVLAPDRKQHAMAGSEIETYQRERQ